MHLHFRPRRIWRISIYLISLLLVLIAIDLVLVQVRRNFSYGYDTTRLIGPLLPDGRVDYLNEIEARRSEGVTPENNAAILFLQAVGREALPPNQPVDGITNKLAMPHLPEQGDYLVQYPDFAKSRAGASSDEPNVPTSWPKTIDPSLRQWIDANAHPLELIAEASKRSRFYIPFDGGNRPNLLVSIYLKHILYFQQSAVLLLNRAVIRLGDGDAAGFRQDVLTVHRLARLLNQSTTAIERLRARERLENPACDVETLAATGEKLSADQARQLAADLVQLGDMAPLSDSINSERCMILDVLQSYATLPPARAAELFNGVMGTDGIKPQVFFRFAPLPYEAAMRHMNHCYDGALVAMNLPTYSRRMAAINLWEQEMQSANGPFLFRMMTPQFAVRQLMLSIARMENNEQHSRVQRRLTEIVLALAAYHADHHTYPASLAALAPTDLLTIPNDPYTDKAFFYSATSNSYSLHSAGPNMIDDGGKGDDVSVIVP
jgi:hypothetical protein